VGDWGAFFAAEAGAAAALAGLVFVGASINLTKILGTPGLTGRAGEALVVLLEVLLAASLALVPGQPGAFIGIELLVVGLGAWAVLIGILRQARHEWEREHPWPFAFRAVLGQAATLPFVAAGIAVLLRGPGALYWVVPGVVCSFGVTFLTAWVLLVEIDR